MRTCGKAGVPGATVAGVLSTAATLPAMRAWGGGQAGDVHVQDGRRLCDQGQRHPTLDARPAAGRRLDSRRRADHGGPARDRPDAAGSSHRRRVTRSSRSITGWRPRRSWRRSSMTFATPSPGSARKGRRRSVRGPIPSPCWGVGRRLPDAVQRLPGPAAACVARVVLGIRRHRRRLVRPARPVLPAPGPGLRVRGPRRGRQRGDLRASAGEPADAILPVLPSERPLAAGSRRP